MAKEYADVIIDISHEALDKVFQYRVPFSLQEAVRPGVRVRIPFGKGNQVREGYVISLSDTADYPVELMKEILELSPKSVAMESQMIRMAAFLKERYGSSMYQALKTVMPVKRTIAKKKKTEVTLRLSVPEGKELLKMWEKRNYRVRSRFLAALLQAPGHTSAGMR